MTAAGLFDVQGKVAVVTGASSGLGVQFAHALASHGAKTVLVARRQEQLDGHVADLSAKGLQAMAVAADLTKAQDIARLFDQVERDWGTPAILVNNAGLAQAAKLSEISRADWATTMALNLDAVLFTAQMAAQRMMAAKLEGSIINIASILGSRVQKGVGAYCTSKAGVIQLTRAMALEWAGRGIRVNALAPGYAVTDINRDYLESPAGQAMLPDIPLRRFGTEGDFDGALLLLASDAGRYMTGTTLTIDGGHTLAL
ncbi:MAG: glucose 1-dehydrogenase [Hyphomicrobiales bacterium]|nr:glucose 1-dehydrogenase [Hyphomicrobiales bacterium]